MRTFNHHKYTWSRPFGTVRHNWELVGPNGGLNFHVSIYKDHDPSAGLEFHMLSGEGAPDHTQCWLTGGRCWHDGTSLYATEQVWPLVKVLLRGGDHDGIFRVLENEYERHFSKEDESPAFGQRLKTLMADAQPDPAVTDRPRGSEE